MTNPTPHGQVPEALQLADEISKAGAFPAYPRAPYEAAAAELRRQHARIADLEAIGAGGVNGPLMTPTPTSGAADLPATTFCWATELAMTREPITLTVKEAREISNEMQRLHALTRQAISAEQAGVPAATVIKRGADREWMSERLGHLLEGVYSLYLAALQPATADAVKRRALVTNWFAEDWAIGKALGLLDDYDAAQREVKP